jgi:hypothetical protein
VGSAREVGPAGRCSSARSRLQRLDPPDDDMGVEAVTKSRSLPRAPACSVNFPLCPNRGRGGGGLQLGRCLRDPEESCSGVYNPEGARPSPLDYARPIWETMGMTEQAPSRITVDDLAEAVTAGVLRATQRHIEFRALLESQQPLVINPIIRFGGRLIVNAGVLGQVAPVEAVEFGE